MEVLVLDGKSYVKASKAARDLGYATDYVGQLCRSGQVSAHLIGRTWYVDQNELSTHRVEKKRMSRIKAREYAKKTIDAHRQKLATPPPVENEVRIQYESDDQDLIPKTRKIGVISERVDTPGLALEDIGDDLQYINKGNTVAMSGTLDVVDLSDGVPDSETTLLTPKISKTRVVEQKLEEESPQDEVVEVTKDENTEHFLTFEEKLQAQEVVQETTETPSEVVSVNTLPQRSEPKTGSVLPYVVMLLFLCIISFSSVSLRTTMNYSGEKQETVDTYTASIDETIAKIRSKI